MAETAAARPVGSRRRRRSREADPSSSVDLALPFALLPFVLGFLVGATLVGGSSHRDSGSNDVLRGAALGLTNAAPFWLAGKWATRKLAGTHREGGATRFLRGVGPTLAALLSLPMLTGGLPVLLAEVVLLALPGAFLVFRATLAPRGRAGSPMTLSDERAVWLAPLTLSAALGAVAWPGAAPVGVAFALPNVVWLLLDVRALRSATAASSSDAAPLRANVGMDLAALVVWVIACAGLRLLFSRFR